MSARRPDLTGMFFGDWRVIRPAESSRHGHAQWVVSCRCGSRETTVRAFNLLRGLSTSCGACDAVTAPEPIPSKAPRLPIFGGQSPEYHAWNNARSRCYHSDHKDFRLYGARGVQMCDAWRLSFRKFLQDMGRRPSPRHTLDRWPNRDGNYEPGNCRWATQREQQRNRRNNRRAEFRGAMLCASELAELSPIGVPEARIYERLKAGWSAEHAINTPVGKPRPVPPPPRIHVRTMPALQPVGQEAIRRAAGARATGGGDRTVNATINITPHPHQSPDEIGRAAAHHVHDAERTAAADLRSSTMDWCG